MGAKCKLPEPIEASNLAGPRQAIREELKWQKFLLSRQESRSPEASMQPAGKLQFTFFLYGTANHMVTIMVVIIIMLGIVATQQTEVVDLNLP